MFVWAEFILVTRSVWKALRKAWRKLTPSTEVWCTLGMGWRLICVFFDLGVTLLKQQLRFVRHHHTFHRFPTERALLQLLRSGHGVSRASLWCTFYQVVISQASSSGFTNLISAGQDCEGDPALCAPPATEWNPATKAFMILLCAFSFSVHRVFSEYWLQMKCESTCSTLETLFIGKESLLGRWSGGSII